MFEIVSGFSLVGVKNSPQHSPRHKKSINAF
jgi:hypothetical protein